MKFSTIGPIALSAGLFLAAASCLEFGLLASSSAFAADSGGGEGGGGHGAGDGGDGHGGGGEGHGGHGGHGSGKESGGLKLRHGLSADHPGHASGVHGNEMERNDTENPGASRRFGGGSGIVGAEQLMEGPGENPQGGFGPGPRYRNQFRYWGGWTLPGEGDGGGTEGTGGVPTDPGFNTGGGGGSGTAFHIVGEPRCADMGSLNTANRLAGRNLGRFRQVQSLLAPERKLPGSAILLLANYQTELEKKNPNAVLAGTYLGMVAQVPVTPELISKASSMMCVIPPSDQRDRIANVAEEQRITLVGRHSSR